MEIKAGTEILIDGVMWAIVDSVEDGMVTATDQDGGQHEVALSRVDAI